MTAELFLVGCCLLFLLLGLVAGSTSTGLVLIALAGGSAAGAYVLQGRRLRRARHRSLL
jgi:hypothetical protein